MSAVEEVSVSNLVPPDLASVISRFHSAGDEVRVILSAPANLKGEALAGWEVGAITEVVRAGADQVSGVNQRRVTRVRNILERFR